MLSFHRPVPALSDDRRNIAPRTPGRLRCLFGFHRTIAPEPRESLPQVRIEARGYIETKDRESISCNLTQVSSSHRNGVARLLFLSDWWIPGRNTLFACFTAVRAVAYRRRMVTRIARSRRMQQVRRWADRDAARGSVAHHSGVALRGVRRRRPRDARGIQGRSRRRACMSPADPATHPYRSWSSPISSSARCSWRSAAIGSCPVCASDWLEGPMCATKPTAAQDSVVSLGEMPKNGGLNWRPRTRWGTARTPFTCPPTL